MGIKGLLKGLSFATRKKSSIIEYQGCRIAIDASSWLHKSVYSASVTFVESTEKNYVDPKCVGVSSRYIISRCKELLGKFHVAQVFLVMDGKRCPLKADESADREKRRQENLREARAYTRNGRMDKAEEKYKMCIKIKDEFTHAVMAEVYKTFKQDNRVSLVWSPYEADAQLAKLCIDQMVDAVVTEDSDVLVYSVASRVAFPIILKLDRTTGDCDIISMAWLLKPPQTQQISKAKSALESLLLNFASRESKRPGFGVRLFVQGCVLAGCDYKANTLGGVGLVNAFKLVRDNSYRNDSVRFKKILDSLPRKVKNTIDIDDYESTLAKSEAVFYYHVVLHANGHCKHIAEPRISNDCGGEHRPTDHSPLLSRFQGELNFLGEIDTTKTRSGMLLQQASAIKTKSAFPNVVKKPIQQWLQPVQKIKNPYSKTKESICANGRTVQGAVSSETKHGAGGVKRFFDFARNARADTSSILKCNQLPDIRYAKRRFPLSNQLTNNQAKQVNLLLSERNLAKPTIFNLESRFDYGDDEDDSLSVCIVEGEKEIRLGTDDETYRKGRTEGNSCMLTSNVEKQTATIEMCKDLHQSLERGEEEEEYISDLGDSDFSPPCTFQRSNSEEVIESRFFKKNPKRRITLEPGDIKNSGKRKKFHRSEPDSHEKKRRKASPVSVTSSRNNSDSSLDEFVDSPAVAEGISGRLLPSAFKVGNKLGALKPRGTIEEGFAKQLQQSSFVVAARKLNMPKPRTTKPQRQMFFCAKPRAL